jgi:diacylglycerol O-acyltransferase/trehalose O-mycolyltransferase
MSGRKCTNRLSESPSGNRAGGCGARRLALLLALLTALLVTGCGGERTAPPREPTVATVVREQRVGPRLLDLAVRSPALGATAMVRLLTPEGWRAGTHRRWPVLYLLHGCCDTYQSWTRSTRIEQLAQLERVLVVMPEGGAVGFYSNWAQEGGPAWETFQLGELRRILERGYGAGPDRAVAGLSMGGLGAIGYAARHPGMFHAAASFSGLLHPLGDPDFMTGLFADHTPDPDAVWGDPRRDRRVWAAHDPTELAGRLQGTRLFVSSGDGRPGPLDAPDAPPDDIEPTVLRQSQAFVRSLRAEQIPARVDFYGAGTHTWPYWERELQRALPLLLAS